mmetsp:Transcript_24929/g.63489  ORF Transcript_24929/g.63489 Transcript_24929/m.63489 type:complete len:235 (-) Transcript_24929:92-796(-)
MGLSNWSTPNVRKLSAVVAAASSCLTSAPKSLGMRSSRVSAKGLPSRRQMTTRRASTSGQRSDHSCTLVSISSSGLLSSRSSQHVALSAGQPQLQPQTSSTSDAPSSECSHSSIPLRSSTMACSRTAGAACSQMHSIVSAFAANFPTPWCTSQPLRSADDKPSTNVCANGSSEMSCGSCETSWPRQKVAVSKLSATSLTRSSAISSCSVPVSSSICVRSGPCLGPCSSSTICSR